MRAETLEEDVLAPVRTEEELHVNTDYRILFEDEHLLAIDKPAPLPVHPSGRFREKNLLSLLKKSKEHSQSFAVVNRLDSETSGVILVAKNKEAAGRLGRQFEKRQAHKEYLAIVFGCPEKETGKIDFKIGAKLERKCHVRFPDPNGEEAETIYQVIETQKDYSLLSVLPLSGKTHQIRAHLAYTGHPVVGDKMYINLDVYVRYVREGWKDSMLDVVKMPRLALHASYLKIKHPVTHQEMEFTAELPKALEDFWML